MAKRRHAALLITRIGKGALPKRHAQRRRDAATLITRVARGKVTRTLINRMHQATCKNLAAIKRAPAARARTMGDLLGMRSATQHLPAPGSGRTLTRSNTLPVRPSNASRLCIIS